MRESLTRKVYLKGIIKKFLFVRINTTLDGFVITQTACTIHISAKEQAGLSKLQWHGGCTLWFNSPP